MTAPAPRPTTRLTLGAGSATLLWFPALGDTAASFGRAMRPLARKLTGVARVTAVNPPGYSQTESSDLPRFEALCEWARDRGRSLTRDSRAVVFAGNSSGAALAASAALSVPDCAGCVCICWPDWSFGNPPGVDDLCPTTRAALAELLRKSWHRPPRLDEQLEQRLLSRYRAPEYAAHVSSFSAEKASELLVSLDVPVALVAGASDGLVPAEVMRASASAHRWPLHVLERCGHYPHAERPRELADVLGAVVLDMLEAGRATK